MANVCRMSDLHVVRENGEGDRALGFAEATHRVTGIMAGGWGGNLEYLRGVEKKLADTLNRVREAIGHAETKAALAAESAEIDDEYNPNDLESARRDRGLPARDGTTKGSY